MATDDIFLIQVARPGTDGIGTPADYATIRSDVAALLARANITKLDDVPDVSAAAPADDDALLWDAATSTWLAQPLPVALPITTGTGSPQGVVSGAAGSLYLRTDANGGMQVYVKVSSTGTTGWLPVDRSAVRRTRREVFVYAGASTSSSHVAVGFQTGPTVTAGATSNADTAAGSYLQHNTTSTLGNVASVVAGANSAVRASWQDASFAMRLPNTASELRLWYGLFSATPSGSDDPAVEGFGFRFSTGAADTTIKAWSNDGGVGGTITDTGIVVAGNDEHDLRAIVNATATAIDFYIDGNPVARHVTNLPATATLLNYGIYCTTLVAGQRALRWGRITLESQP